MLIRSLRLINFKKYSNVFFDDLPERGVIKVGGKNESGKTSVGEAVCFALFGRTFLHDEKNAKRLIHWDKTEMTVVLVLIDDNDAAFEITRTVNDNGLSSIRIVRLSDQHTLTGTLKGSEEIVDDLLGYSYAAFIDSFCMLQRELTTPDINSDSIKQIAGIADYGVIADDLVIERDKEKHSLNELKPSYTKKDHALKAIELDESWLPELIDAKESLLVSRADKQQLITQLDEINETYSESWKQHNKASKKNNIFESLGVFFLPLMLGAWIVWGAFQFFPETIPRWLPDSTSSHHASAFIAWVQTWMFPFAMGAVLLYGISLFFNWLEDAKIGGLKDQAEDIFTILQQGHQEVTNEPSSIVPKRVAALFQHKQVKGEGMLALAIPPADKFSYIPQLIETIKTYQVEPREVTTAIENLRDGLYHQGEEIEQCLLGLAKDINIEKQRSDNAGKLRAALQKISQAKHQHQHNIIIRDYSIKMVQRVASQLVQQFNQSIIEFSAEVLPHFTANAYSQLKINEDFTVEIFSDKKHSYIAYDEISSGTQRQIMLALRIGMSEQLARNTKNKKHFIFLDEPFAFFDQQRTVSTLKALPNVSDIITQVWVTSQEFPEEISTSN
jgi:exonuclease SbcC